MSYRRFIRPLSTAVIAMTVGLVGYVSAPEVWGSIIESKSAAPKVLVQRPEPQAVQPLTLGQALQLASVEAHQWSNDAAVVTLRSFNPVGVRTGDQSTPDAAAAGGGWEAVFTAASNPNRQSLVRIVNGTVVRVEDAPRALSLPAIVGHVALESPQALALARPGLEPQHDRGNGYTFNLATDEAGRVVLSVLGSIRGQPARVDFDALSGKKLGTSVFTYVKGGIVYSPDGGTSWQPTNVADGQITGITPVPDQPRAAYAVVPTALAIEVHATSDGGRSWRRAGTLPVAAGGWAYDIAATRLPAVGTMLSVGTATGLWISGDGGASWDRARALPDGPPQWLSPTGSAGTDKLVVSVTAGPNAGLYGSSDLKSWQRLVQGVFRVSRTATGSLIATDDRGGTQAYSISDLRPTAITTPVSTLRVVGDGSTHKPLVSAGPGGLSVSRDGGANWQPILHGDIVGLASNRDTSILLAASRTEIQRSTDGGATWHPVLTNPSTVLAGSGRVTALTFLSDIEAVAVNGGLGTWVQL